MMPVAPTLNVILGVEDTTPLDDTRQIIIVGTAERIRALGYASLAAKLGTAVSGALFEKALQAAGKAESNGSTVPLYLEQAYLVVLPTKFSRYASPAAPLTITKVLKGVLATKCPKASIVLIVERKNLFASVCSIARALPPLYSRKTGPKNALDQVTVEVQPLRVV